jgi:hypothetical protein
MVTYTVVILTWLPCPPDSENLTFFFFFYTVPYSTVKFSSFPYSVFPFWTPSPCSKSILLFPRAPSSSPRAIKHPFSFPLLPSRFSPPRPNARLNARNPLAAWIETLSIRYVSNVTVKGEVCPGLRVEKGCYDLGGKGKKKKKKKKKKKDYPSL